MTTIALKSTTAKTIPAKTTEAKTTAVKPEKEHSSRFFSSVGDAGFKIYFFSVLLAFCVEFAWILIVSGGRD